MSLNVPQTETEIRNEFSDRGNYFSFMCMVSQQKGTRHEAVTCEYARRVMIVLGYPIETATWDNARTINYAQNIVMMG